LWSLRLARTSTFRTKPINNRLGAVLAFVIIFIGITKYYLVSEVEEQLEIEGYVFCSELIKGRYHREVYQKTSCSV